MNPEKEANRPSEEDALSKSLIEQNIKITILKVWDKLTVALCCHGTFSNIFDSPYLHHGHILDGLKGDSSIFGISYFSISN
jgi:hypothetical protein